MPQLLNQWHDSHLRLGVFGGSFDPPHSGHLAVSRYMREHFALDYVLWIPALHNPLKAAPSSSFLQRAAHLVEFLSEEQKMFVSDIERHIAANSGRSVYTYEVIEYLAKALPFCSLHLIMGADNLLMLHKWKNWQSIIDHAQILVYGREPYTQQVASAPILQELEHATIEGNHKAQLVFCDGEMYDVSSTELRSKL